jgi:hypothetical protein
MVFGCVTEFVEAHGQVGSDQKFVSGFFCAWVGEFADELWEDSAGLSIARVMVELWVGN